MELPTASTAIAPIGRLGANSEVRASRWQYPKSGLRARREWFDRPRPEGQTGRSRTNGEVDDVDGYEAVERVQADQPWFHVGGTRVWSAMPGSLRLIARCSEAGLTTLETGCGASTVVFAATGSEHTVISPDAQEHRLVREYCERVGVDDSRVTYVADSSDSYLPGAFADRVLDFSFIDGAHSFPYPVVDWHYIAGALRIGGRILLDDIPIPAVAPVFQFMKAEDHWALERIVDDRAALFRLTTAPPGENYRAQRFNRRADYSFASPATRLRLHGTSAIANRRAELGERYPALRSAWRTLGRSARS